MKLRAVLNNFRVRMYCKETKWFLNAAVAVFNCFSGNGWKSRIFWKFFAIYNLFSLRVDGSCDYA